MNTEAVALIYEGPNDDAPETLMKIKGCFIADLDFSIPEVQLILGSTPSVIRVGSSRSELETLAFILEQAGAKVHFKNNANDEEVEGETVDQLSLDIANSLLSDESVPQASLVQEVETPVTEQPDKNSEELANSFSFQFDGLAEEQTSIADSKIDRAPSPTTDVASSFSFDEEASTDKQVSPGVVTETTKQRDDGGLSVSFNFTEESAHGEPPTPTNSAAPGISISSSAHAPAQLPTPAPVTPATDSIKAISRSPRPRKLPQSKFLREHLDTIVMTGIGVLILSVANYLYFSSENDAAISIVLPTKNNSIAPAPSSATQGVPWNEMKVETNSGSWAIRYEDNGDALELLSLIFTATAPTAEIAVQLATDKESVWLNRIEVIQQGTIQPLKPTQLTALGYISIAGKRSRSKTQVAVVWDPASKKLSIASDPLDRQKNAVSSSTALLDSTQNVAQPVSDAKGS